MTRLTWVLAAALSIPSAAASRVAESENAGQAMYLRYCGACHGPAGKGDGIAGTFMRPKPADLTQIARKNGGEFPLERTMAIIDGRTTMRAHGDPDMPVWGEVLSERERGSLHRRAMVRGILTLITEHLRSIQEK